ncbi:glycosyltransferase family 2 protein [Candidatus Geothermarchaeota archaeon]|nr:MAG: glycosyltransferase family 2 protein [Candidatus Geothermarchaeota archaeon]
MGVSIILPAYNEEDILEHTVREILKTCKALNEEFEIIIVDNGSKDSTPAIGKRISKREKHVKFFRLEERGVGKALKLGLGKADFEKIVTLDVDLSVGPNFILRCASLLNEYDIVIGSKRSGNQRRSLLRRILSRCFIWLSRCMLGMRYDDYSIGAKGYRKSTIMKFIEWIDDHTFYVLPLVYLAEKFQKKIVVIPVNCIDKRKSRFSLLHEIFWRGSKLIYFSLLVRISNRILTLGNRRY